MMLASLIVIITHTVASLLKHVYVAADKLSFPKARQLKVVLK